MTLGEMKLKITPGAQEIIQSHVNEIHKNQEFFDKMVDKAQNHFPYVVPVLKEEGIPEEFKYLMIQESGFRAEAVSVSNAVGFWQFKDFTAREVGLYVDRNVDERKHIVYSTRGAAKYLKKNYFYLKNWLLTCQSYQQGLGGTSRSVDKKLFGLEKMTVDKNTYWYPMKFLAHVIAYRDAVNNRPNLTKIDTYIAKSGASLKELSKATGIAESDLKENNPWLKGSKIPDTREEYILMLPEGAQVMAQINTSETITIELEKSNSQEIIRISEQQKLNPAVRIIVKINGKKAILSNNGDSPITLALRGGITKDNLLKFNDMIPGEDIKPGMVYYLQKKSKKSSISQHIVKEGETLWIISQKYGIREASIRKMNRMALGEEPEPRRMLNLKKKLKKGEKIEYVKLPKAKAIETNTPIVNEKAEEIKPEVKDTIQAQPEKIEESVIQIEEEEAQEELELESEIAEEVDSTEIGREPTEDISRPTNRTKHIVSAGETLYSISRQYGVSVEQLVEWNELKNLSLSIGQEILIFSQEK